MVTGSRSSYLCIDVVICIKFFNMNMLPDVDTDL